MTLKSLNKKFAVLSLSLLAAATLASAGVGVNSAFAKDTSNQVSSGEVIINAQSAAGNASVSSNNDGSNNDEGVSNNQTGGQAGNNGSFKNDGTTQTDVGATMANVKFAAAKFTGTGAPKQDSTDTWASSSDTTNYRTVTTNASGVADFGSGDTNNPKLTDGYWKFSQITTVNGITTVNDFIVYVNTTDSAAGTVNVYPKLDMSKSAGLGDVATTNADDNFSGKTPNDIAASHVDSDGVTEQNLVNSDTKAPTGNEAVVDGTWGVDTSKDNANTTTAGARDTVNWNVNSVFDSSQTNNTDGSVTGTYGTYIIKDTLPNNLVDSSKASDSTVKVNVNDGTGKQVGPLSPTTDYTVSNDGNGNITVTLTAAGQAKVASMLGNADGAINVVIPSTVRDGVYGSATDKPSTTITNAYGADLSTAADGKTQSTLNVGALDFTKVDNADNTKKLDGATFVLVKAKDKAAAVAYVEANSSYFNNNANSVTGVAAPVASTDAEFVTDASGNFVTTTTKGGVGTFTGLNLVDDNTNTQNGPVDTTSTTDTGNYFAVEVQAPTGYQLPNASDGSNVFGAENATTTTFNSEGTTDSNQITNAKPFALPFTGGEGVIGVLIIALGITGAAIVIKRNKRSDEEVVVK